MKFERYLVLTFCLFLNVTLGLPSYAEETDYSNYNESAFDETKSLTEQEEKDAETYIHQGRATRKYNELCDPNDAVGFDKCINQENGFTKDDKFLGINMQDSEKIIPIISQVYSMFGNVLKLEKYTKAEKGVGGDKYVAKDQSGAEKGKTKTTPNKKDAKRESQQDYCAMIPTATEMISTATQTLKQDNIQSTYEESAAKGKSQQADALAAVAQAQKSRSTTSWIQMGGWSASAACYAAMIASGGLVVNGTSVGKLAAAGLLASFYGAKANAHARRAKSINEIIEKLPGAGDCNPHTNTSCFCNEETSIQSDPTNYQKYCTPREYQDRYASNPLSCVDANNQVDNECKCAKTKSCISSAFNSKMANLQFGTNSAIDPLSLLRDMENGLSDGALAAGAAQNLAFANKILDQVKVDELGKMTLDDKQKSMADTLSKNGVPKIAAAMIASQSPSPNAAAKLGLTGSGSSSYTGTKAKGETKSAGYETKTGSRNFGTKKSTASYNPFAKFGKKEAKSNSAVQIEDYSGLAEKAYGEAQISKDTSRPIFDIITYRYKLSAWKRFEDQINKEIAEESKETKNQEEVEAQK